MELPKYGATILLGGALLIGGVAAVGATYIVEQYRREEVRPFINTWEDRVRDALQLQKDRPELRKPAQGELLENIVALNTFDK